MLLAVCKGLCHVASHEILNPYLVMQAKTNGHVEQLDGDEALVEKAVIEPESR